MTHSVYAEDMTFAPCDCPRSINHPALKAQIAFAHCSNGTAYVTIALNGAAQTEVREAAKLAFANLGVEYDGLANSARMMVQGNYATYSQACEEEPVRPFDNTFSLGVASKTAGF